MTAAASRSLRKDAARNRAALLEAARAVFADRGLDASLDDIAHHAGVGVGTAYRHFANRYELAGAILREAVEEIVGLAHDCVEIDDPWEAWSASSKVRASRRSQIAVCTRSSWACTTSRSRRRRASG